MEAESNDVWDYFEKCDSDGTGEKRAKCRVCSNIYNYSATIHNLKIHLVRKHSVSLPIQNSRSRSPKERRKRSKEVWSFFSRVEGKEKFASCHYCDKILSYQTTTNNLKTHLRKQHPAAYARMELALQETAEIEYVEEYLESDNEEGNSSDGKQASDLWGYFETENATSSICCVCCASVPSKPAELRRHLVTEHPKLMGDLLSQDSDRNEESYSEVIYLEENPRTKEQKIVVKKLDVDGYKRNKRRRVSPEKKKSVEEEEVESFGSYITCLMKQLPRDVCTNVQRDIINLIMNAKTRNQIKIETQQHLIKEIMNEIQCDDVSKNEIPNHSFNITVVEEKNDSKLNVTDEKSVEDPKSNDDKSEDE